LLKQVRESGRATAQANQQREERFRQARDQAAAQLRDAQAQVKREEGRVAAARQRWTAARAASAAARQKIKVAGRDLETLYDAARGAAVDLHDTAKRSLVTAQFPKRMDALPKLAASETLPGPEELEALWQALLADMEHSGEVARFPATVVSGEAEEIRDVTRIGVFTAFSAGQYHMLDPDGTRLQTLARQPPRRYVKMAREFEQQRQGMVPALVDPSRGALLLAEANRPGLFERLWSSGVGGYFIAGILLLAIGLVLLQFTWLHTRLLLDEHSIGVTVAVMAAFALIQWWLWTPRGPPGGDEIVAQVSLVTEQPETDEPPPPDLAPPPPPPPEAPTSSADTGLAGLPALAAPAAAPIMSNITMPVKIAGGGSLTGAGFGGFARGSGTGAGAAGYGRGAGFKGKELIPLSTARPQMPEWACKQKIRGWVEAVFTVLPNGRVQDVKIIDAQPRGVYEIAAIESISNWIYAETDGAHEVKQRVPMDPADCAYNWQ